MTEAEALRLEQMGFQLDDINQRLGQLRDRVLECLCTNQDLTDAEEAEIKRYLKLKEKSA